MPAPLPKTAELAERLRQMAAAPSVDEFALQRIAVAANKLFATDAAGAHALLGGVATLRWDVEEAKRRFNLAIPLGDPVVGHCDYAASLTFLGLNDEAFDAVQTAFERAPDNLTVLRRLIDAALSTARFSHARSLCATWHKLSPVVGMPHRGIIEALVEATTRGHFTENGARSILLCASTVRRDHRARLVQMGVKPSVTESGTFFANLRVIGSPAQAADLNEALAGLWADSPALMDDPGLRFVPMFLCRTPDGHHR